jgi:hypothetical protein
MKRSCLRIVIIGLCFFSINCGKHPTKPATSQGADLTVWAHIIKHSDGLAKIAATTWDSLVIRISPTSNGAAMDTMVRVVKFGNSDPFVTCTLDNVPAGKGRFVEVWTKNDKGLIIHSAAGKKIDLASGEIKTMDFTLIPKRGSIYVEVSNVPVSVGIDTITFVYATFAFSGQMLLDSVKRAKNAFLTIDNVPDSSSGTLFIAGIGKNYDTLYRCAMPLAFYALRDTAFSARAVRVTTGISMNITAPLPFATMVSASMDPRNTKDIEKGPCIISEIMYAANDSEYVEIYNPLGKDTTFDTLILDIDGAFRYFPLVAIKAGDFFVFGRKNLPWVDATHSVSSALDLLTGGGNTIVLRAKDSSAMDRVSYLGGPNNQEWPNFSSIKKSIVLDSLVSDPTYNNFGKNWTSALTLINTVAPEYTSPVTAQYGTPGYGGR